MLAMVLLAEAKQREKNDGTLSDAAKASGRRGSVAFGKKGSARCLPAALAEALAPGAARFSACSQQEKARV